MTQSPSPTPSPPSRTRRIAPRRFPELTFAPHYTVTSAKTGGNIFLVPWWWRSSPVSLNCLRRGTKLTLRARADIIAVSTLALPARCKTD